jgi:hypothetical protein
MNDYLLISWSRQAELRRRQLVHENLLTRPGVIVLLSVQVVSQVSLYFGLPLPSVVALDLLRRRAVRARRVART